MTNTVKSCSARVPPTPPRSSVSPTRSLIAQRAGETGEEIARVTGYTVPMIRAVLLSS
jgi:hypothetical protein